MTWSCRTVSRPEGPARGPPQTGGQARSRRPGPGEPGRRHAPTRRNPVRTLHVGLRVTDLERSLAFYTAVGYEVVGSVPETGIGHLTMLKLPDDDFVTIELVHDPAAGEIDIGTGLSHVVIQVEAMDATVARL